MSACPHCPDGHRDPAKANWGVFVASERDHDGQPTHLRVEKVNGSHVADSDADWLWQLIRWATTDGEESCEPVHRPLGLGPTWGRTGRAG